METPGRERDNPKRGNGARDVRVPVNAGYTGDHPAGGRRAGGAQGDAQGAGAGGYHVLEADGSQAATRIAGEAATGINLLLTDMIMPAINGAKLARRVRELRPGLQTLFMTGHSECEALRLAKLEIKNKHIQKPFTVRNLLAQVADALAERGCGVRD